jgi:hypothetical protein
VKFLRAACVVLLLAAAFIAAGPAGAQGVTVLLFGGTQSQLMFLMPPSLFGFTPDTMPATPNSAMSSELGGALCRTNKCITEEYPASLGVLTANGAPGLTDSIETGVQMLSDALANTPGKIIVFGLSQGAVVSNTWMSRNASDPRITFVSIGDPTNTFSGVFGRFLPDVMIAGPVQGAGHKLIEVIQRQDGYANFPSNLTLRNLAADMIGMLFVHLNYTNVNLIDPSNIVTQDGDITYVLTPTQNMPTIPGYGSDNPPGVPLTQQQYQNLLSGAL